MPVLVKSERKLYTSITSQLMPFYCSLAYNLLFDNQPPNDIESLVE